jgi:hypothetical protein
MTYSIRRELDNANGHIGYAVYSPGTFGGEHKHFSRLGSEPKGLAKAYAACEDWIERTIRAQEEERRILARLPTEAVDRYIVEHMDCSPERFAAFGKATRRSWRRRARQEMMKL